MYKILSLKSTKMHINNDYYIYKACVPFKLQNTEEGGRTFDSEIRETERTTFKK